MDTTIDPTTPRPFEKKRNMVLANAARPKLFLCWGNRKRSGMNAFPTRF